MNYPQHRNLIKTQNQLTVSVGGMCGVSEDTDERIRERPAALCKSVFCIQVQQNVISLSVTHVNERDVSVEMFTLNTESI